MKNIKIKLASQYQTIEFDIEDINEDLTPAIDLINSLGEKVKNTLSSGNRPAQLEPMATPNQIKALERFHIDASKMTKKQASAKLDTLLGK